MDFTIIYFVDCPSCGHGNDLPTMIDNKPPLQAICMHCGQTMNRYLESDDGRFAYDSDTAPAAVWTRPKHGSRGIRFPF